MRLVHLDHEYSFDPGRFTFGELRRVEQVTGLKWKTWMKELDEQGPLAFQALLWLVMRRENANLTFDEVEDIMPADLQVLPDRDEAAKAAEPKRAKGPVKGPDPTKASG